MPIRYTCVGCREDLLLPDAKAGQLCSCPFCRLKFLAPAKSHGGPVTGSVAPPASQLPRRPPPPLYPVDQAQPQAAERRPAAAARTTSDHSLAPVEADELEDQGLFGGGGGPGSLFGEDELEIGELFGGPKTSSAQPPAVVVEEELEIPDLDLEPAPLRTPPPSQPAPAESLELDLAPEPDLELAPEPETVQSGGTARINTKAGNRLIAVEGLPTGTAYELPPGKVYLIGRDKQAEVKILSTSVSRKQARIDTTGGRPVLIDLGSANGTRVNGEPVDRHPLVNGDLIKMGVVTFRYEGA